MNEINVMIDNFDRKDFLNKYSVLVQNLLKTGETNTGTGISYSEAKNDVAKTMEAISPSLRKSRVFNETLGNKITGHHS